MAIGQAHSIFIPSVYIWWPLKMTDFIALAAEAHLPTDKALTKHYQHILSLQPGSNTSVAGEQLSVMVF